MVKRTIILVLVLVAESGRNNEENIHQESFAGLRRGFHLIEILINADRGALRRREIVSNYRFNDD